MVQVPVLPPAQNHFFTDSIDIIDHDSALFPDKVICFQSYAIVFLLRSPAQNTGSLILISTRFHRKRTCLVSFSVIITYLRILCQNQFPRSNHEFRSFVPPGFRTICSCSSFSITNIFFTYCSWRRYFFTCENTSFFLSSLRAESI